MTNKKSGKSAGSKPKAEKALGAAADVKMRDHVVTEEDLLNNPEWAEQGAKVGDTVQVEDIDTPPAPTARVSVRKGEGGADFSESVDIVKNGVYVRTYSIADHGDGYRALAEQFATKNGAEVVDGGVIRALEVSYKYFSRDLKIYTDKTMVFSNEDPNFREAALRLKSSQQDAVIFVKF